MYSSCQLSSTRRFLSDFWFSLCSSELHEFLIVNGSECKPHSQPWQVLLKTDTHLCSGSLISDSWVIDEKSIRSERVIAHPQYDSATLDNDIMLIKLSKPAVLNEYVKLVNLPKSCVAPGTMCNVSGWGITMNQSVDSD
ncbi:trypsin 2 [Triplophysa rosa]|uniref:Trypsin 2 n=1 Tax=Triplophysa rosa TaxID=992332 RepID=A0A9W7T684_TRIRA|nr:trypsin 2 [Triplophysa rosa]